MAKPRTFITFEATKDFNRMIEQRAKQEGVSKSEYVREAVLMEFLFSGDDQAVKWVQRKLGTRMRGVLRNKLRDVGATVKNAGAYLEVA